MPYGADTLVASPITDALLEVTLTAEEGAPQIRLSCALAYVCCVEGQG